MAIELTISHGDRLVVANVGTVGPGDFERYFDQIDAADAMSYRKIIDLTASPLELHAADIRALAQRVNNYASNGHMGAMAIVVNNELAGFVSELYEKRVDFERPFRMFPGATEARAWLDEPAQRNRT